MFKGHGREVGHIASQAANASFQDQLSQPDTFTMLRTNPKKAFTDMFSNAHNAIRQV